MNMHVGRVHFNISINKPISAEGSRRAERAYRLNKRLAAASADRERWTTDATLRGGPRS